jgi:two-component system, LytTR family, response regulator LytT
MRILIVEDEPLVAQRLERVVREVLGAELLSLYAATTLDAAISRLENADDIVLLLDLNLGGEDGFNLLRRAVAEPWSTIVVSGNTERALEAFELGVVDFVGKPFTAERLNIAFQRARERRGSARARYLAVAYAGNIEIVPLADVVAIHGDDDYSSVELANGQRRLHKRTLAELERLLPPEFLRVHRSHIANLQQARRLEGRVLKLANGSEVPVGRAYARLLSHRLM